MKTIEQHKTVRIVFVLCATILLGTALLAGCSSSKKDTSATQYSDPTTNSTTTSISSKVAPKSITLNKESITIAVEYQLEAKVDPADADQEVIWSSSDDKIATVDDKGLVKAVKKGETEIIATSKSDSTVMRGCSVKVEDLPTSKTKAHIALDDSKDTLKQCLECH